MVYFSSLGLSTIVLTLHNGLLLGIYILFRFQRNNTVIHVNTTVSLFDQVFLYVYTFTLSNILILYFIAF